MSKKLVNLGYIKVFIVFLILLSCIYANNAASGQIKPSDPFRGKFSTSYPFKEERFFSKIYDLYFYLNKSKNKYVNLKKDEFETNSDFQNRVDEYLEKIDSLSESDKKFTIEFKINLGTYSHKYNGFPIRLLIYDYRARVHKTGELAGMPRFEIAYGSVLSSNYWETNVEESLHLKSLTGNLTRNISYKKNSVMFLLKVSDLNKARQLRKSESTLVARIVGTFVERNSPWRIIQHLSKRLKRISHSYPDSDKYIIDLDYFYIYKINIDTFKASFNSEEFELIYLGVAR